MKQAGLLKLLAFGAIASVIGYGSWRLAAPGDRPIHAAASASAPPATALGRLGRVQQQTSFSGGARVIATATDARGDVVIAGALSGTVDFGGGPLASAGEDDVFVAKLDATGKHLWSKRFGGPGYQAPAAVAIDARGDVVIAGTLDQSADFGGGTLTSAGMIDVFVLKLSASGEHLWSKRFGDATEQEASAVAIDRDGDVVLAGSFEGTLDFGGGALKSAGEDDVYVAKLDASGKHLWSKRFGDERGQRGRAVAIDADGSIVIAGRLAGTVDFGGGRLAATDAEDLYLARFDARGQYVSAQQFRGGKGAFADPRALSISKSGVIVTGLARGSVDLGAGPLAAVGEQDAFVLALDPAGKTRFARRFGGTGAVEPKAIAALADGAIVVAGQFDGTADFGGKPLSSAGKDDALVFALDAEGAVTDARRFGDAARQIATSVAAGKSDAIVIAGNFDGALDFGAGPARGPGVFVTAFAGATSSPAR